MKLGQAQRSICLFGMFLSWPLVIWLCGSNTLKEDSLVVASVRSINGIRMIHDRGSYLKCDVGLFTNEQSELCRLKYTRAGSLFMYWITSNQTPWDKAGRIEAWMRGFPKMTCQAARLSFTVVTIRKEDGILGHKELVGTAEAPTTSPVYCDCPPRQIYLSHSMTRATNTHTNLQYQLLLPRTSFHRSGGGSAVG